MSQLEQNSVHDDESFVDDIGKEILKDTTLTGDQRKKLIVSLVQNKMKVLGEAINARRGHDLLHDSKKQATITGKTWFLVSIPLADWLGMHVKRVTIVCLLDVYCLSSENNPDYLQLLANMNPIKEYMLAFEIVDHHNKRVWPGSLIYNPSASVKGSTILKFILVIKEQRQEWYCSGVGCQKVVPGLSLKTCARCHLRIYCSRECQLRDWPLHKMGCPLMKILYDETPGDVVRKK